MRRVALLAVMLAALASAVWLLGRDRSPDEGVRASPAAAARADEALPDLPRPDEPPFLATPAETAGPAPLVAPAPPRISGTVLRASDGTPLKGVSVRPMGRDPRGLLQQLAKIETDEDGRFTLGDEVVALGPRSIDFCWTETQSVRYADVHTTGPTGRDVRQSLALAEAVTPLDQLRVTLDTGWSVRGRVTDEAGRPVEKVGVETDFASHWVRSDTDGSFLMHDLAWEDPNMVLVASCKGYAKASVSLVPPVRPAWERTAEIVLVRAPAVSR